MENKKALKNALKHPTHDTLNSLPEYMQALIYTITTYCIDTNEGKVEKARKFNELIIPIIKIRLSSKPDKKIISKPADNIFSKLINKDDWPCETCMLNNDKDSPKCISCGTQKPGIQDSPVKDDSVKPKQEITLVENYVKKPTQQTQPENIEQPTYSQEEIEELHKGYTDYDERGFRSSISCFSTLKEQNLGKNMFAQLYFNNSQSPAIKVYFNIDKRSADQLYLVKQSYKTLGADSENTLYGELLIEYIKEILMRKNKSGSFQFKISKIDISTYNEISRFYIDSLGIVWNHEDCADCHIKQLSGLELDPRCKKLIHNNCSDNFRHRPKEVISKPTPKPVPKPVPQSKQEPKKIKKSKPLETDQRGVNSIIIACKEVLPKNPTLSVDVYINDSSTPEFKITYTSTSDTPNALNGIYKILKHKDTETNNLRFEPLKQYIHNIFDKNSKKHYTVSKINLSLLNGDHKRFYIESLGIVWNQDDCTDCILQEKNGEELTDNCKKLLKEKCGDKFKYRKID